MSSGQFKFKLVLFESKLVRLQSIQAALNQVDLEPILGFGGLDITLSFLFRKIKRFYLMLYDEFGYLFRDRSILNLTINLNQVDIKMHMYHLYVSLSNCLINGYMDEWNYKWRNAIFDVICDNIIFSPKIDRLLLVWWFSSEIYRLIVKRLLGRINLFHVINYDNRYIVEQCYYGLCLCYVEINRLFSNKV